MSNGEGPTFEHTTMESVYQRLPADNRDRLNNFSRLTGVSYGSVYYPYLVCCEYYLYLLTTLVNSFPSGKQIDALSKFLETYEKNIPTVEERVQTAQAEVIRASNPNRGNRQLAIVCCVTGLFAFAAGAAFTSWERNRTQLQKIADTSEQAMQIYYLNQDAIKECQQNFKSKSGKISCPYRLVVPSK